MDISTAASALRALAQDSRLEVFRLLVRHGPEGLPAGEIARSLGVPHNTMSAQLSLLSRAGLIASRRDGRSIIYAVDLAGTRALLSFLTEDCCQGRPELCAPLTGIGNARTSPVSNRGVQEAEMNILFLCTQNSARSILAECVLNQLGEGRFRGFSAGSQPRGEIQPLALSLLRDKGYDTSGLRTKSWDEFARSDAPMMDAVVTVCDSAAKEACPVWPGHPATAHWGLPDPARAGKSNAERRQAFAQTLDVLSRRISALTSLPPEARDPAWLRQRLREIAQADPPHPGTIASA